MGRRLFPYLVAAAGCASTADADGDPEDCPGCGVEGTCGEDRALRFVDHNNDPALPNPHRRAVLPIAAGADYELEIYGGEDLDQPAQAANVTFSADETVELIDTGELIALHATGLGEALMEVETADGQTDRLPLEVRALESAHIIVSPRDFTWSTLGIADPTDLPVPGYALLPGATVHVSALLRDEAGGSLAGHGLLAWSVVPDDAVQWASVAANTDAIELTSLGTAGTVMIDAQGYDTIALELVPDASGLARLDLFEATTDESTPLRPLEDEVTLRLPSDDEESGGGIVIASLAIADSGHVLVGAPGDDPVLAILEGEGSVVEGELLDWPNTYSIEPVATGTAMVEVSAFGQSRQLAITVAP